MVVVARRRWAQGMSGRRRLNLMQQIIIIIIWWMINIISLVVCDLRGHGNWLATVDIGWRGALQLSHCLCQRTDHGVEGIGCLSNPWGGAFQTQRPIVDGRLTCEISWAVLGAAP